MLRIMCLVTIILFIDQSFIYHEKKCTYRPDSHDFITAALKMGEKQVNPFYHRPQWTICQYLKILVFSFTLLPIRLIGMGAIFLVMYTTVLFAFWFGRNDSRSLNQANSAIQQVYPLNGNIYRKLNQLLDYINWTYLWICGFHDIKINGEPSPQTKILVCAPHSTFADSIVVMLPHLKSIVSKKSAQSIPFIGTLVSFLQPIWVERDESSSRRTAALQIVDRVKNSQLNSDWPQICIFPEGTCTNRTALISFKKGAFYPGFPVQPVTIKYLNKFYLPVYHPNEGERNDPSLYAENVRTLMANHLRIPKSDYGYEDCKKAWRDHDAIERFTKVQGIREQPYYVRAALDLFLCAGESLKMAVKQLLPGRSDKVCQSVKCNGRDVPTDTNLTTLSVSNMRDSFAKYLDGHLGPRVNGGIDVQKFDHERNEAKIRGNAVKGVENTSSEVAADVTGVPYRRGSADFCTESTSYPDAEACFTSLSELLSTPAPTVNDNNSKSREPGDYTNLEQSKDTPPPQISIEKLLVTIFIFRARYVNNKPLSEDSEKHLLKANDMDYSHYTKTFTPKDDTKGDIGQKILIYECLVKYLDSITDDKSYVKRCFDHFEKMVKKLE